MTTPMTGAPPLYVEAVPTLNPPRHGLLSVADVIPASDPHFANGIEQLPNPTGEVKFTGYDVGEPADPLEFETDLETVQSGPINIYWGFSAKSVAAESIDLEGRVLSGLTAGESAGIESAIWHGLDGGSSLMGSDTEILTPSAVPLARGIGLLEKYFWRQYGGTPVLHTPRDVAELAAEKQLIQAGAKLTTILGSTWSFGNYPNVGVTGVAAEPGTAWIVASGQVQVHRGDIEAYGVEWNERGDGFDARTNQVFMLAQRTDVVSWDGITAAVLIQLDGEYTAPQGSFPSTSLYPSTTIYPEG